MIAMMRAGIRIFWAPVGGVVPKVLVVEFVPVAFLLMLCTAMAVQAGPLMRYADDAARALHAPAGYAGEVLAAPRIAPPEGRRP
jgi:multicomponent K+:H+ antiporter subunit D